MLKYYVSFIVYLATMTAYGFEFQPATCSISSTQTINLENTTSSFSSKIQMDLIFSDKGTPIFKVIFLEHAPTGVSLSWTDIQTHRNELNFFTDDLMPAVRSMDSLKTPLIQTRSLPDPLTFEVQPTNLLHAQVMVALFLTQNSVLLTVNDSQGSSWESSISLQNSDKSFRDMASRCFPQASGTYLELDGSRRTLTDTPAHLTPSARAVSTGYGLVDFMTLLQFMPVSVTWDSFTDPNPVIELLSRKKALLSSMSSVTGNADFQASSQEVGTLLQKQRTLSERLTVISAPASETATGLVIQKENEEQSLRAELTRLEGEIAARQKSLVGLDQRDAANQTSLTPFLEPLTEFENKTSDIEGKFDSLSSYKRDIEALLQTYRDQLTADFFATTQPTDIIGAPWSLEEINKQNEEITPQIRTYQALNLMGTQLTELHSQFAGLITQSQQVSDLTEQFLSFQSNKSQLDQTITDNENAILRMNSMPNIGNLDSIQFSVLLSLSENNAPQGNRSYDVEFNFHKTEFDNLTQNFSQILQTTVQQRSWSSLICDWKKLIQNALRTESLNCLITTDFLNEKTRNQFLEHLSPQVLDSLIDIPTQPWTLDISKIDYVSQAISADLNGLSQALQPLLEIEQRIRILVWRWNAQQKSVTAVADCESPALTNMLTTATFSQEFYTEMFACDSRKLQDLIVQKDQAHAQSMALTVEVTQVKATLEHAENEFIVNSNVFSDAVNSLFSKAQDAVLLEDFYKGCLDLSQGVTTCQSSFQMQSDFQGQFSQKIHEIDLQIRSRTLLLQQELDENHTALVALTTQKTEFVQTNGIEQLLAEKEAIATEINQTQHQLKALADLASLREQSLTENTAAQLALQQEALQIVAQQTLMNLQIENIQNSWAVECASFAETNNELQALDQQLMQLMTTATTEMPAIAQPQAFSLLCQ